MNSDITPDKLAACEKRAIELYYASGENGSTDDFNRAQSRAKLDEEFGEACVKQMLRNGFGRNQTPTTPNTHE